MSGPTRWSESGPLRATDVNPKQSDDIYDDFYQDNALETAALIGSRNGDYKFVDYAFDHGALKDASHKQIAYIVHWLYLPPRDDAQTRQIAREEFAVQSPKGAIPATNGQTRFWRSLATMAGETRARNRMRISV